MKKKMFTLMFGLLLAVGWTSVASAQALPQGGYADRLGLTEVTASRVEDKAFTTPTPLKVRTIQRGPSVASNAPRRANNKPDVVYPKSYYDTLMYTWVDDNNVSHTDPATKLATDPNQMYELLRFVYMDKRFPGPYYSAFDAAGARERKVYYGGVAGGWDIPFTTGSQPEPVGDITIVIPSNNLNINSITVTINGVATTFDANTAGTTTVTYNGNQRNAYTLPTGWQITDGDYFLKYQPSGSTTAYGYFPGGGTITIPTNGATYATVAINGSTDNVADGITINNEAKTLTTTDAVYTWTFGSNSGSGTYTKTFNVVGDITLTGNGNSYAYITSIQVTSGSNVITSFTASSGATTLPAGWTFNNAPGLASDGSIVLGTSNGVERDLIITSDLLAGYPEVTVSVTAYNYPASLGYSGTSYPGYVYVNGTQLTSYTSSSNQTRSRTIQGDAVDVEMYDADVYTPNEEGYTALIVSVNNNITKAPVTYPENDQANAHNYFNSREEIIEYFRNNVKSIQLLTDGLRIGEGEGEGTVFNCSGTYNKFFFLGKGQAREKDDLVFLRQHNFGYLLGEYVPFKEMFEEFSPTDGESGSQITDFYIEMMDGSVYDVVHDCASVIENGHQFSMSGNTGTQEYAMSGMNFFIPDYRLKYWEDEFSYRTYSVSTEGDTTWTTHGPWTVDGRTMNPYKSTTGSIFRSCPNFTVNTAQYIKSHAPKVGLYVLTLDAEANPCQGYDVETNHNYVVTLDWTSSLNEMSGKDVPQTYVIYEVITNEDGSTRLDSIDTVEGQTHYDFNGKLWPQGAHSETHTYIIMGTPADSEHPEFVAWSNEDAIVIPGLNDFLELGLTHHESDFDVPRMQNWYRNFLVVNNDGYVGLTTQGIVDGDSVFNLMRFANIDSTITEQVAQLKFENMTDGRVKYTVRYVDENGANTQDIEAPKYELTAMNIPVTGYLTTKHDNDIIIQPNGYDVNFLSISVQAGSYSQTWNSSQQNLPNGWSVSDGSMWVLENGARYLEGGGYILIPAAILGNYTTATVTVNAYGDPGKTAKISVNGDSKAILNGVDNARNYVWTLTGASSLNAPAMAFNIPTPNVTLKSIETNAGRGTLNAPKRAARTKTVTFTPGTNVGSNTSATTLDQMTNDNVSISCTLGAFNVNNNGNYRFAGGSTTTITAGNGKITRIEFTGASSYPVSRWTTVTPGTLTTSGNNGTWTGEASAVTLTSAQSQVRCSRIVVTVEWDDENGSVTIGDGTYSVNMYMPVYGTNYNSAQSNQMIYKASDLGIAAGSQITSLTFYPSTYNSISGINFSGGKVTLSIGNTTVEGFASAAAITPDDLTQVAEVVPTVNTAQTAWTFTFTTPFTYTGGNLLVQVNTEAGTAGESYFESTNNYTDYVGYVGGVGRAQFVPKVTFTYQEAGSVGPVVPTSDGVVRMANLRIVDQFAEKIPVTNDHPYRYTYFLKLAGSDKESSMVPVTVQHTGAQVMGYYTQDEMLGDTVPAAFLTEDVLSAQVNMNLSPTSAPYFYTVNSVKNGVPTKADDYSSYLNVLQRRSAGDYQEMQTKSSGVTNPMLSHIYQPGENNFFDFRKVCAQLKTDSLSYVPIIWTNGINRHYYVADSLHNSYGAPIWETRVGDVSIISSQIERQAQWNEATQSWVWNPSVNWYDEGQTQAYSLYMISDLQAEGILPVSNVEYEPYMFRLWLVDSTQSLRGYQWELDKDGKPIRVTDDPESTPQGAWVLLDTKMCNNYDGQNNYVPDLVYSISKVDGSQAGHSWDENIIFGAKLDANFRPRLVVRFYYKVKGARGNMLTGINDDDNVGYVVIKGTNPHDPSTGVIEIMPNNEVVDVTYYNVQGMQSDKPFSGINIVVTRYSNGATTTTKVLN